MRSGIFIIRLILFVAVSVMTLESCHNGRMPAVSPEQRRQVDSLVRTVKGINDYEAMMKRMNNEHNALGSIMTLRFWGDALRNECRYDEALKKHDEALRLAKDLNDTLEHVQALNNVGTDYRRFGIQTLAYQYHYNALVMARECSDTSHTARKNIVVSLNGLANVYLTIGNLPRAETVLREALEGERALKSNVGMAINYANIGSVFERRNMMDSAFVYYTRSMECNRAADNMLGIALCHTYFGKLYETKKEYDKALNEYLEAYHLMETSHDDWHALNTLQALAGIYYVINDDATAVSYLEKAEAMAKKIDSNDNLAKVYNQYYLLAKRRGNCAQALAYHEKATELENGLVKMDDVNRMQNTSLSIERTHQQQMVNKAHNELTREKRLRNIAYFVFSIIFILLFIVLVLMVYTQRVRARSHKALMKMSQMRDTFYRNITHEFRTPLTVILGLSEEMQHGNSSPADVSAKANIITRQGNRLLSLVNQLLGIAKVKSAVGNADWRWGDIVEYIGMIVDTYRDYARSRNIELIFMSDEKVEMDFVPDYAEKVFGNLLSNAFKFTKEYGRIIVRVKREDSRLLISVSDTGEGMTPESMQHIFEPFYQAETDSQSIGTGLGLALVKQIIDDVGGEITVDSEPGKGTMFNIVVPVHNEFKSRMLELEPASARSKNRNAYSTGLPETAVASVLPTGDTDVVADVEATENEKRILIVEDNRDVAEYVSMLLSSQYAVYCARNGAEGLERASTLIPDIIITDLMMPGMGGLEMCQKIRENELTNHIPVIILTAKVTEEDRIEGLRAGADAYLTKPFSTEELRVRVAKLLEQRQQLRQKYATLLPESEIDGTRYPANQPDSEAPGAGETTTKSAISAPETDNLTSAGTVSLGLMTNSEMLTEYDRAFLLKVTDTVYAMLNNGGQVDVNAVAAQLCMSYSQFYRKLSAITTMTPAQYIQRVKVKKAQRMLMAHPERSFREVADRCGFNDYASFVRAFRNVCGITPSQFVRNE